jgi:hypothetical protein
MVKIKPSIQMKGGELPSDCLSLITYMTLFAVFVLSMYTIYMPTISLFGVVLLYIINLIFSVVLTKDVSFSSKSVFSPFIVYIIIAVLGLNIASSTMIMLALYKINRDYAKREKKMELSEKARNTLSIYVALWIATIVIVWVLSIFYYVEPTFLPYFSFEFMDKELNPLFVLFGFLVKTASSAMALAASGYMVYLANLFFDVKTKVML